jgi:photosystem II stability/assembly factor-like uncharacterized protein
MPWLLIPALVLSCAVQAVEPGSTPVAGLDLLDVPALQSDKARNALLLDVAAAGDRLVVAGERGIILYSDDNGVHWTQATVPVSVTLTSLAFPAPDTGFAAGHDGVVLITRDAGANWTRVLDGNVINRLVIDDLSERLQEFEASMDPDSDDDAERFDLMQMSVEDAEAGAAFGPSRPIMDLWFANAREGMAIGAFGLVIQTRDAGATWASATGRLPNPESLHLNRIERIDGLGLVIAGERGLLWVSADSGDSWRVIDTGYSGHLYGVQALPDGTLVAYGFAGNWLKSTDGGESWQPQPRFTEKSLVAAWLTQAGNLRMVARDGHVFEQRAGDGSVDSIPGLRAGAVAAAKPVSESAVVAVGTHGVSVLQPATREVAP